MDFRFGSENSHCIIEFDKFYLDLWTLMIELSFKIFTSV
jgi:hypothetical protein